MRSRIWVWGSDKPVIGDPTDWIVSRHLDPRRLPLAGSASAWLPVGRGTGLNTPIDLSDLAGGPPLDHRRGLPKPPANLLGVLIPCATTWHLGRIAPPPEVLADGPHRHLDLRFLADQRDDGTEGTQRRSDPYILGALLVEDGPKPRCLAVIEGATGADRAVGPLSGEAVMPPSA